MGIVIGKSYGCLELWGTGDDLFGELSALSKEFFVLLTRVTQCTMDLLVFDTETIKSLIRAETGKHILELSLELFIGNGLNAKALALVAHDIKWMIN